MPEAQRKREVGRGERVLPGVWRLRLPLPWPGVPHGNAWALAAGDGIVLVDTGIHEPGSWAHLERALAQCNLRVENIRLLVCTHAHSDHYGEAKTIVERTGCELWMHPDFDHMRKMADDPDEALRRRLEVARTSGVPEAALQRVLEERGGRDAGVAGIVEPDRELLPGVEVRTDLGTWTVHETPGHAPSHVVLHQAERRLLLSGDQVLGRVSLWFDYGWTPDPMGEFLRSCDVVDGLDVRLALPGHGRTFSDVPGHTDAARKATLEIVRKVREQVAGGEPTAFEVAQGVFGEALTPLTGHWLIAQTMCALRHLEVREEAVRMAGADGEPERWRLQP
ncbi:MBL fold metallo-hydrolase [Conexibacter sp. SYSU D00693]|uniref:MBL fold metallo-hydrolase n=1 Tax=Conexibacter sp. SYSU D00693 TaxID=2812560 RepID=UPI00196B8E17|nr:MBL fold metallo-hydrolase [Conexibacter sp. SYSU D00693]